MFSSLPKNKTTLSYSSSCPHLRFHCHVAYFFNSFSDSKKSPTIRYSIVWAFNLTHQEKHNTLNASSKSVSLFTDYTILPIVLSNSLRLCNARQTYVSNCFRPFVYILYTAYCIKKVACKLTCMCNMFNWHDIMLRSVIKRRRYW